MIVTVEPLGEIIKSTIATPFPVESPLTIVVATPAGPIMFTLAGVEPGPACVDVQEITPLEATLGTHVYPFAPGAPS